MATVAAGGDVVDISDVNLPNSVQDSNGDNATGVTVTTTPQNGATICGEAFTAPASGRVLIWFSGTFSTLVSGTGQHQMGPQVRSGATVGSGTVVFDPSVDPGCKVGSSVGQTLSAGCSILVEGLTAGSSYNVCATYFGATLGGTPTMSYFSRQVGAMPAP
jgi:hypothetical protein